MTRRVWMALCAVLVMAFGLAGCGGGGGGGGDTSAEATTVKQVMSDLLVAGAKGIEALPTVKDKLDGKEFETAIRQSATTVAWDQLPQEKRDEAERGCFNQLLVVSRETVLSDRASIDAALAAGKITILSQTRTAYSEFEGKPAEGNGKPVKFKAKLSKGADNNWRLVLCELSY